MTETAESGQSGQIRSRLRRLLTVRLIIAAILGGILGYIVGLNVAYLELSAAKQLIQQMRADNQKLKADITEQNAQQVALQAKLTAAQVALEAIVPSENTYNVKPNQSIIVAGGRLTVGLIGSPANERVNININGKQQSAATGDVINVALDPPITCQVRVQSFDMFKAILAASCGSAQPR